MKPKAEGGDITCATNACGVCVCVFAFPLVSLKGNLPLSEQHVLESGQLNCGTKTLWRASNPSIYTACDPSI